MDTHPATPVAMATAVRPSAKSVPRSPGSARVSVVSADFATVYRDERDRLVRALALAIRDDALAAEAIDEAFTRALHRWHVVGRFDNPAAWIYRTARNWATSRFRRLGRDRRFAPEIASPDHSTDDEVPDPRLTRALATLDADRRNVLVLRFYLDWSVEQVADALDISPGTVKSRTHRALAELNQLLGGER